MNDLDSFKMWLRTAPRGSRFCYYMGYIARDRGSWVLDPASGPGADYHPTNNAEAIATLAWTASRNGRILLTQKRLGAHQYAYYATKRRNQADDFIATEKVEARRRAGR